MLSLSLGVAASSTVYSVADALTAPAAGVRDSGRVVDVGRGNDGSGFDNMSHPAFEYLRQHATTFDGLAGVEFGGRPMSLTIGAIERAGLRHAGLGQLLRRPGHASRPGPVLPAR